MATDSKMCGRSSNGKNHGHNKEKKNERVEIIRGDQVREVWKPWEAVF